MSKDNYPRRALAQRLGWRSKPREPIWQEWDAIQVAPLWELVAVSLRIEPDDIRGWGKNTARCYPPPEFHQRLRFAVSLLSTYGGGLPCKGMADSSFMSMVEPGNYYSWLAFHGYLFPVEFPKQPASSPPRKDHDPRKVKLTARVEQLRSMGQRNFMALVAKEEGLNVSRLQQIIGTRAEREKTMDAIRVQKNASESGL